LTVHC